MPRYRHKVNKVVVSLADGHSVNLGSEWEELGKAEAEPAPPVARRRKRVADDEDN